MSNPEGLCKCGCGQKTRLAPGTDSRRGWIKGQPINYIIGHQSRLSGVDYIIDPETNCWIWQLSINNKGYGVKWHEGRMQKAHRVMYEKLIGPIPDDTELDHKCRNIRCCNPGHLEAVTHEVNNQRGAGAKYPLETILQIRNFKNEGLGSRVVSKMLGIPRSTVGFIMNRRTWKNV